MTEADIVFEDDADQRLVSRKRGNRVAFGIQIGGLFGEIDLHGAIFTDNNIIEVSEINFRFLATFAQVNRNSAGMLNRIAP